MSENGERPGRIHERGLRDDLDFSERLEVEVFRFRFRDTFVQEKRRELFNWRPWIKWVTRILTFGPIIAGLFLGELTAFFVGLGAAGLANRLAPWLVNTAAAARKSEDQR
jgi:hypothetical protein